MNCEEIMEIMTAYMVDKFFGKTVEEPPKLMIEHILACPSCSKNLQGALRFLTGDDGQLFSSPLSCTQVDDRMPEMIDMDENRLTELFPVEWEHIQHCSECLATYREARACIREEHEKLFEKIFQPTLQGPKNNPVIWESLSQKLHKLSVELTILAGDGINALSQIPEWLGSVVSVPMTVGTVRSQSSSESYLHTLTIFDPKQKRRIVIKVRVDAPDRICLSLSIEDMKDVAAIGGVAIALFDANGRYLKKQMTPEIPDGPVSVEFSELKPGGYQIRITECQMSWEIPLQLR